MLKVDELNQRRQVLLDQLQRLEATIPRLQSQSDAIRGQLQLIEEMAGPMPQGPVAMPPLEKEEEDGNVETTAVP